MRKAVSGLAVLVLAALLGWAVHNYTGHGRAAAPHQAAAVPVTAGTAETRDMPIYVRGIGAVQAYNTVTVKSRVDGQIVKVDFVEGQEVKKGDLLFEIDPRPFQAALEQAQANKEKDEAQLTSALADLKRDTDLVGRGFQTRQVYDQQKALVAQTQAAIKADQAQIDGTRLNLQYAAIRSPIDGRTGARLVDVGNLVHAADGTALVTITQLRPIFVSFTAPQSELDRIRESHGQGSVAAEAYSEDDKHRLAAGRLTLIDNRIDPASGTIHLKATFDNRDEALWPGEFVSIRLVVGTRKNAVTVPARAIQQGPEGAYLFVIGRDMTAEIRAVKVAEVEEGVAVISKGLAAGERIVVDGQYRLDRGTKVRLQSPPPGARAAAG